MSRPKKSITFKVDLTREDVLAYIREGLKKDGFLAPDDDDAFKVNEDAVNAEDVLVEVVSVSVAPTEREKGASLADLRAARANKSPAGDADEDEAPRPRRKRDAEEPRQLVHDEDDLDLKKSVRSFNAAMPPAPPKGKTAVDPNERPRKRLVGETLDDLGKDPTDMSDEIG